jgi:hypothetical protein
MVGLVHLLGYGAVLGRCSRAASRSAIYPMTRYVSAQELAARTGGSAM